MTTPEQIDKWLESIGKDRQWLADKIGIRMGTLYNCFSKGFTARTMHAIELLMKSNSGNESGFDVTFSAKEFELIEQARKLSGHATRAEFYRDAIMEFTDELIEKEKQSAPTVIKGPFPTTSYSFPSDTDGLKVAER